MTLRSEGCYALRRGGFRRSSPSLGICEEAPCIGLPAASRSPTKGAHYMAKRLMLPRIDGRSGTAGAPASTFVPRFITQRQLRGSQARCAALALSLLSSPQTSLQRHPPVGDLPLREVCGRVVIVLLPVRRGVLDPAVGPGHGPALHLCRSSLSKRQVSVTSRRMRAKCMRGGIGTCIAGIITRANAAGCQLMATLPTTDACDQVYGPNADTRTDSG